jgi:Ca2+-binding RTX toxin-like protein
MRGRLTGGIGLAVMIACSLVPSITSGSVERRGGNHSCDTSSGTFRTDHFWPAGDQISVGLRFRAAGSFRGFPVGDFDQMRSENTSATGEGPSSISCSADVGAWTLLTSSLGPGDDSIRLDGKGLDAEEAGPYGALPKTVDALLKGGGGNDKLRGHLGLDKLKGGGGDDVIKADDGRRDLVVCGDGEDKADVDPKDIVRGCETKT